MASRSKAYSGKIPTGHGKEPSFGGVVVNAEGKILLRKPKGEFDGYVWTFAKGRPKSRQTPEETALQEVEEETGWQCEIIRKIPGRFEGGTTVTEYFLMRPRDDTGRHDDETKEIVWVTPEEAEKLISMTQNGIGRCRDLAVLKAALVIL